MMFKGLRQIIFLFATTPKNPYKVLGLFQGATEEQIKNAYYKLAKQYHPDVKPQNVQIFKEINEAYNTLRDPVKRSTYDHSTAFNQQSQHYSNYYNQDGSHQKHQKYDQYSNASRNAYYNEMFSRRNMNYNRNFNNDPYGNKRQQAQKMRREFFRSMFWQHHFNSAPRYMSPLQMIFVTGILFTAILTIGSLYFNLYKYDQLKKKAHRYEYLPYPLYQEEDDELY